MRRLVMCLLGLCTLLGWASADAATRYAAQNGTGNACTVQGTPCTFAIAFSQAVAGDTVVMLSTGGPFTSILNMGSKTGPITVTGQGTAQVTNTNNHCITMTSSTDITIQALNIGPCGATNGSGNGSGIRMQFGSGHKIYDNYIHPETFTATGCCDTRDGLYILETHDIEVQGNVLAFGEGNIQLQCAGSIPCFNITVHGNYSLNPRGPRVGMESGGFRGQHIQSSGGAGANQNHHISYTSNYLQSIPGQTYQDRTEDMVNMHSTHTSIISDNYLDGTGGNLSFSGTGVIAEATSTGIQFLNNKFLNVGHVGVQIVSGTNTADGNKIFVDNQAQNFDEPNATGLSVFSDTDACSGNVLSNNIVYFIRWDTTPTPVASYVPFYFPAVGENDNICSGTNAATGNNFNQASAFSALNPFATTNPPPLKPPFPKNCVAVSPYSTQTSLASCDATVVAAPAAPTNLRIVSP